MHRVLYLLFIPGILLGILLIFAACGVALPFAPFTPSLPQLVQALVGWVLISFVVLGIARRWRITRAIVGAVFLYLILLTFYAFWYGSFAWPRLLVRLACYGFVAWVAYSFAPPLRKAS